MTNNLAANRDDNWRTSIAVVRAAVEGDAELVNYLLRLFPSADDAVAALTTLAAFAFANVANGREILVQLAEAAARGDDKTWPT